MKPTAAIEGHACRCYGTSACCTAPAALVASVIDARNTHVQVIRSQCISLKDCAAHAAPGRLRPTSLQQVGSGLSGVRQRSPCATKPCQTLQAVYDVPSELGTVMGTFYRNE